MSRKKHTGEKTICPDCHDSIPKHSLHCPTCLARKSHAIYLEQQKQYIPEVLSGLALTVVFPVQAKERHIRLIGEPTHTWCGERIPRNWFKLHRQLDRELREQLCPGCREALDRLRKELPAEVA